MSNTSNGRQRIQDFELYFYAFLMNEKALSQLRAFIYYLLLITYYFSPKGTVKIIFPLASPQKQQLIVNREVLHQV